MVLGWMAVNREECGNTVQHTIGPSKRQVHGMHSTRPIKIYGSSHAWRRERGSCIYWLINKFDAWRRNWKKPMRGSTMLPRGCSGTEQESLNWKKGKDNERCESLVQSHTRTTDSHFATMYRFCRGRNVNSDVFSSLSANGSCLPDRYGCSSAATVGGMHATESKEHAPDLWVKETSFVFG